MKFTAIGYEAEVDFTLGIDDEGDLVVKANGIYILGIDHEDGGLISYSISGGDRDELERAGFRLETMVNPSERALRGSGNFLKPCRD
jgi:hypothetical protein